MDFEGRDEDPASPRSRSVCWWVTGRVQGVGFRYFVQRAARAHGLEGDVRNLPDGRVEIRVRGPAGPVGELLEVVCRGPGSSHVTGVEERELDEATPPFDGFRIRF